MSGRVRSRARDFLIDLGGGKLRIWPTRQSLFVKIRHALPAPVSRREALRRLSAGSLLALGLWPGALRSETPRGSFRFLVINDTHCMSPECCTYLQGVVAQMKPANADFCLHAGDLTDKAEPEYFEAVK